MSLRQQRVARSHTVAAAAFRLGAGFLGVAIVWALVRLGDGGPWWGPLHAFLLGTVLLAISGATQLFTVTWSAAVPADRRLAGGQRWAVALGAAAVLVGVTQGYDALTLAGAALVGAGVAALGVILVGIVRRSLLRRFDLATRFYLLATTCGVAGVTLGAILGVTGAGASYLDLRTAHLHLNLVGLVGFTILGTLPTLLPTTVHHTMVSGREAVAAWWGCAAAAFAFGLGAFLGPVPVGIGCALVAAATLAMLGGIVGRLGVLRVVRAGLPALLIATGALWLAGWAVHQAVTLMGGTYDLFPRATAVGVAGVGLVLFGSLAYLLPVLAGPGEHLTANFARMQGLGTIRAVVANAVPVLLAAGAPRHWPAVVAAGFLADHLVRAGLVVTVGRR